MEIEQLVKKLPFYNNLADEQKDILINSSVIRSYSKNSYLYDSNDECLGLIYILNGSIRVYISNDEGREITLFHIKDGEYCIFSASCVISGISLDVQLNCEEETKIMAIHADTVKKLLDSNIYVKCFAYEVATKRFSSVVNVMREILFARFDVRMARFLLNIYDNTNDLKIKMTQEAIAKEINSAREVVARTLNSFKAEGLIELSRGYIVIKDLDGLQKRLSHRKNQL